jgi:hypothetical protein
MVKFHSWNEKRRLQIDFHELDPLQETRQRRWICKMTRRTVSYQDNSCNRTSWIWNSVPFFLNQRKAEFGRRTIQKKDDEQQNECLLHHRLLVTYQVSHQVIQDIIMKMMPYCFFETSNQSTLSSVEKADEKICYTHLRLSLHSYRCFMLLCNKYWTSSETHFVFDNENKLLISADFTTILPQKCLDRNLISGDSEII